MISPRSPLPAVLAAALLLGGCAGSVSSYPSLAPRAVEQPKAEPAVDTTAKPLGADVLARVAALVEQAKSGDAAFAAAARAGCGAIDRGRGAAEGGEGWVAAQQALSAVEAERQATVTALTDLNSLVLEQVRAADASASPIYLTPITTAADQVGELDAAESARLSDLRETGCRP